jgi:superfamily I DNA/RNA helicase
MSTVPVAVRRAGRVIDTIERPLRASRNGPAVVYKRKWWLLKDGHIDIDGPPLEEDESSPSAPEIATSTSSEVTSQPQPDDTATRRALIDAPAAARLLVEAGPGTGKTEVAARRVANLIRTELSPGQIMVLSFSRSAVRTLTRRLDRIGETDARVIEDLRHLSIRTFDSWAFRMLRLLGESPRTLLARGHDENIATLTALAKGSRREDVRSCIGDRRHLIVDEFQDLPGVRGDLVLTLLALMAPPEKPGCGFTILGDPAQAIYAFARGKRKDGTSYPTPQEYWREVCSLYQGGLAQKTLTRNYRTHGQLAQVSMELRGVLLSDRTEKEKLRLMLAAVTALPAPTHPLGRKLVEGPLGGSRAILTRTNGEALRVLQRLLGNDTEGPGIPVRVRAGNHAVLSPAWIAALLRKLQSTSLPRSQFGRIHAFLAGQWGADTCRRLALPSEEVAWARLALASGAAEDASSIDVAELRARLAWPDAFPDDQSLPEDGVLITTVHQSKGMEFDIVTMLDAPTDIPDRGAKEGEDEGPGERASVAYVAMTRAGHTLERVGSNQIYQAPKHWDFADGRRRLCYWKLGWVNMEMGLRGDVDPLGFADPTFLGGARGVEDLQSFLLKEAGRLEGRKVMLCKQYADRKALWHIHIQEGTKPGRLIGRTSNQLSIDLLSVLHERGYKLPPTILNLRISSVGTITADGAGKLGDPERTSGLWLGVGVFGTGDFQTRKGASK